MMDWLAELIGLPEIFQFRSHLGGGGVIQVEILHYLLDIKIFFSIQGTASESTLMTLLVAKNQKLKEFKDKTLSSTHLVAYTSGKNLKKLFLIIVE